LLDEFSSNGLAGEHGAVAWRTHGSTPAPAPTSINLKTSVVTALVNTAPEPVE
jgi:hypothetical protein